MLDDDEKKKVTAPQILAGGLITILVASSVLPLVTGVKSLFSSQSTNETFLQEKLSRVPVFAVTDSTGRPFLSEVNDGRLRQGYFFVQPADASAFLDKVRSTPGNEGDGTDARIIAVGMNDVIKFLDGSSISPSKSIPERFQLFPDDHQVDLAQTFSGNKFRSLYGENAVPVFYVDGLAFKDDKTGGTVIPVFFEKEKLDEAVANLKKSNPNVTISENDLEIMDFLQTVRELRTGTDSRFGRIVYVPLSDALNKLNSLNAAARTP